MEYLNKINETLFLHNLFFLSMLCVKRTFLESFQADYHTIKSGRYDHLLPLSLYKLHS